MFGLPHVTKTSLDSITIGHLFGAKSCNQNTFKFTKHQVISCLSLLEFRTFSKGKLQRCFHPFQSIGVHSKTQVATKKSTVPLPRYCEAKDASTSSCHRKLKADVYKTVWITSAPKKASARTIMSLLRGQWLRSNLLRHAIPWSIVHGSISQRTFFS